MKILEKNAVVKNADGTLAETTAETETETASKIKNVCNDPVQAEALAAGPLQVFHKKNCNCEVTEHYISKISEEET